MTKVKNLIVAERLGIIRFFNQAYSRGGLDILGLKRAQNIGGKLELTEKEKKDIEWKDLGGGQATFSVPKAEQLKIVVEFFSDEVELIKEMIMAKNKEKTFASADMFVVGLTEKLDIKL